VRVWSLADGKLKQTIRTPAGPGNIGRIYTVAISPDGDLVAAGGWTKWTEDAPEDLIYLFEPRTGKMAHVILGLPATTDSLAFSPDGRYLAAGLFRSGLRVFDRNERWAEIFRDTDYGDRLWGIAFGADGRLATASGDRLIRLYDSGFRLVASPKKGVSGNLPYGVTFSCGSAKLAVGYFDVPAVDLFDGQSLALLSGPNLDGLAPGGLGKVAWSADGTVLFAGGLYYEGQGRPVLAWAGAGAGERRALQAGTDYTITGLAVLPGGALLVAAADPFLAVLEADGRVRWAHSSPNADFRVQNKTLAISAEGAIVDFGFELLGKSPLRFDVRARKLSHDPPADDRTSNPKQDGLPIEHWENEDHPTLDGQPIELKLYELSQSLAVHPDGSRFVLGTEWSLRAYNAKGELLWRRDVPSIVWAVNIAGDGRLAVAAYADGTIRWHRMDDGRELLALYVLADKQNWVAWTPEGFYGATPGAFGVLRWHVNRGFESAAETVPVSEIPKLRRPDALPFVLQELETARALGIADMIAARREVQIRTGAAKAPGARLHVLAIGVSDYGEKVTGLALKFAHKDAEDVASALLNTQGGGLYAEVLPIFLSDCAATKAGIFEAFDATGATWRGARARTWRLFCSRVMARSWASSFI
jgi:WD40 repeat protein